MEDNWRELDAMLEQSAGRGVGHSVTLLSTSGFRRAAGRRMPPPALSAELLALRRRHRHLRVFRDYLARMDAFLDGGPMPRCRAGARSFNVDHVGNVSPCIEKIDTVVGSVRREGLAQIHARMADLPEVAGCQACWTACRGFSQSLGDGRGVRALTEMAARMRSA